jgi:hypothetical protein
LSKDEKFKIYNISRKKPENRTDAEKEIWARYGREFEARRKRPQSEPPPSPPPVRRRMRAKTPQPPTS